MRLKEFIHLVCLIWSKVVQLWTPLGLLPKLIKLIFLLVVLMITLKLFIKDNNRLPGLLDLKVLFIISYPLPTNILQSFIINLLLRFGLLICTAWFITLKRRKTLIAQTKKTLITQTIKKCKRNKWPWFKNN